MHDWTDVITQTIDSQDLVLVHGDAQMSNVLVDAASGEFVSLIDWGCAHVGTRAIDFRVVPIAAVGPMLDGYRDIAVSAVPTLEAEILLARLQLLLHVLSRGSAPGLTWGERPLAWLTDLALHAATHDPRWAELLPTPRSTLHGGSGPTDTAPEKATHKSKERRDQPLAALIVVSGPYPTCELARDPAPFGAMGQRWMRPARRAEEPVPVLLARSIRRSIRSILLVFVGAFSLVVGFARQQVEGVALGVGVLLLIGGFHLILVAIEVERSAGPGGEG